METATRNILSRIPGDIIEKFFITHFGEDHIHFRNIQININSIANIEKTDNATVINLMYGWIKLYNDGSMLTTLK